MFARFLRCLHSFQVEKITELFSEFWQRTPALFFGLSILLGCAAHFHPHPLLLVLTLLLAFSWIKWRLILLCILCFSAAYIMTAIRNPKVLLSQESLQGKGTLHIEQIKIHTSAFHRSLLYKGVLEEFNAVDGTVYNNLPCSVFVPISSRRPTADCDYTITGRLQQKGDYTFVLKPDKKTPWDPLTSSWNFSEWRYQFKQKAFLYLKQEIKDTHVRTFLNALLTGDIDERILSLEFGKIGLQHILAISGFHFALAALFLNFVFRLLFPFHVSGSLLILTLTLYFLFLGNAPSILRAYIAISLVTAGQLFNLRTTGLNALGIGLIIELIWDPLVVTQLSFQLTFLCTLAILLFYPLFHNLVGLLLPKRTYAQVSLMTLSSQHGYILSACLRKSLALNFAVHFLSLPVLLHLFHKFPLLSLAYNLFFPACVSLSLLLLFSALLLAPLLPFLSHWIHTINNLWTSKILYLSSNPPSFLDFSIRSKDISFTFVLCFLGGSILLGIFFSQKSRTVCD